MLCIHVKPEALRETMKPYIIENFSYISGYDECDKRISQTNQ